MPDSFEIIWSKSAVSDLDEILEYIAERDGVDRALELYEKVRGRISTLKRFPRRCRYVPELKKMGLTEFRESILSPYRIFFRLVERQAVLLGVLDSRRDLEEILRERALALV